MWNVISMISKHFGILYFGVQIYNWYILIDMKHS